MSLLKKRRKNINIVNKPQQWRSFSVDDVKLNKPTKISNPIISGYDQIKNTHKFNEYLLRKASESPSYTAVSGDKMAVIGSQNPFKTKQGVRDWYDDFRHIPVWGDVRKTSRYSQLNKSLEKNPETNQLVAHSLGSSVILEKQIQNPGKFETVTYNAPVLQLTPTPQGNRYRFNNDIISGFDKGAKSFDKTINPISAHSYSGLPSGYSNNTILPDNTQILIE